MIEELRTQIASVQRNLALARNAGLPYEMALHRARLDDLVAIASRNGVDITASVDRTLLAEPAMTHD